MKVDYETGEMIPTISIIVLTYNALEYTQKCLKSILENTNAYGTQLIVVDNNSQDGTKEWLQEQKYISKLFLNDENKGVAGGRNQGIDAAVGDYIIFLDNDTEVGPGWDRELISTFKGNIGVVGNIGNKILSLNPITFYDIHSVRNTGKYFVDVVPGFCFAFPRTMVATIGKQSDKLGKFWHEDLEFCLKAREAGYAIVANTDIDIVHHEHKSVRTDSPVSNEEMLKLVPGSEDKAVNIAKMHRDDNVLHLFRGVHENCRESYCVLADSLTENLREMGMIVLRENLIYTNSQSFDLCKGFEMNLAGNSYIIAHVENDIPPRHWLPMYEKRDFLFCASPYVYHQLLKAGVSKEKLINTGPDGYQSELFNMDKPTVSPLWGTDVNNKRFAFLTVGAAQPRKGTDLLIMSYIQEFTKKDNVVLVIKNYGYGNADWINKIIDIARQNPDAPAIEHIYADWTNDYLAGVYRRVAQNGAYISTHRGEAFGLPIYEALGSGCRVGCTNWGGAKYVLDNPKYKGQVTLFDHTMEPSTFHNWSGEPYYEKDENPMWAKPDEKQVRAWMRKVYNEKYNENLAREVAKDLESKWDAKVKGKEVYEAFKRTAKIANLRTITA